MAQHDEKETEDGRTGEECAAYLPKALSLAKQIKLRAATLANRRMMKLRAATFTFPSPFLDFLHRYV